MCFVSCGKGKENGGPYKLNCDIYINHEYISHLKMRGLMKYSELVLKCDPLFSDLLPDWSRGCSAVPLV